MGSMRARMPWEDPPKKKIKLSTGGEKAAMILCMAMLLFAASDGDIPLLFFSLAFLIYEVHSLLERLNGDSPHPLSNFCKGLSLAMFFGSLAMAFLW